MMIPSSCVFDQSTLTALLEHDPVVQRYRAFFSLLDWSAVQQWQERRSAYCDTHGHPITAYLKAFLIRIGQGMLYMTQLRSFLLTHPLLIIELGFQLHLDPTAVYGFDPEKTLPCLMFLRILFAFLSENFSRGLLQAAQEATSLMNGAASVSRITFPCYVWHFVFSKRRPMTVFSRITFRFATSYDS